MPSELIVPPTPPLSTPYVTALFTVPVTVATNPEVWLGATAAVAGERATLTAFTEKLAVLVFVLSATLVAVSVQAVAEWLGAT